MTISTWLRETTKQLKDIGIESARLDAELILAHTLRTPRIYLHAHLDEVIDARRLEIADARTALRLDRTPLAYIIGHKEFYGRRFRVTPDTLIPRPESEDMIGLLLAATAEEITPKTLVDVGSGSGCLGITAKLERPNLTVILTDISRKALTVADKNAHALGASITTLRADLLNTWAQPVDYILANLPYVDELWTDTSPELRHEPSTALYASRHGLSLIFKLLPQAARWLTPGGLLLIEADPTQHTDIIAEAAKNQLTHETSAGYILQFRR